MQGNSHYNNDANNRSIKWTVDDFCPFNTVYTDNKNNGSKLCIIIFWNLNLQN